MNPIRRLWQRLKYALTGRYLCDTCKYDYGDACLRPERPNAIVCPDYSKRGT